MKRAREEGSTHAYSKVDGAAWIINRAEYSRLREEWMAGKAFFEGVGFYGSKLVFRLNDIYAIAENSPESLAAQREDEAANKHDDAITGDA